MCTANKYVYCEYSVILFILSVKILRHLCAYIYLFHMVEIHKIS